MAGSISSVSWTDFLVELEARQREVSALVDLARKAELGQFLTPAAVARYMAGLFTVHDKEISFLDAGAGMGMLSVALIAELAGRPEPPKRIRATLYEIDPQLARSLRQTMAECADLCAMCGIRLEYEVLPEDFVEAAAQACALPLAGTPKVDFDCAILNPPYRKINGDSDTRRILSTAGIEVNNLYSAFLALAARLLRQGGELVAITPRSFCNGPYFRAFRRDFFSRMVLHHIHVYESRSDAFRDDEVLQENLILHARKTRRQPRSVIISTNLGPLDPNLSTREVPYEEVIRKGDPEMVVHVITDETGHKAIELFGKLKCGLHDLGLSVSTGRVVDFRARSFLRTSLSTRTVPLIYPFNLQDGRVVWPKVHPRKPIAIVNEPATSGLLIPSEIYVVVKRFSAKEERRRIAAALYDPTAIHSPLVGFENHLNYFHSKGCGLDPQLARGLVAFLNSTLADAYFRVFNGHTQVNAQDLRRLRYPSREGLLLIAERVGDDLADQQVVDQAVQEVLELVSSV